MQLKGHISCLQTLKSLGLTDLYCPPHSAFVSQANSIATAPCLPRGFTLQISEQTCSLIHVPVLTLQNCHTVSELRYNIIL